MFQHLYFPQPLRKLMYKFLPFVQAFVHPAGKSFWRFNFCSNICQVFGYVFIRCLQYLLLPWLNCMDFVAVFTDGKYIPNVFIAIFPMQLYIVYYQFESIVFLS
jgi:hypothetical protein